MKAREDFGVREVGPSERDELVLLRLQVRLRAGEAARGAPVPSKKGVKKT
jgi:hypothetical protein